MRKEDVFRSWRVKNPKSLNSLGHPRSYHLQPGGQGAWKDVAHSILLDDFFVTKYAATEFPYSKTDGRRMLAALSSYMNDESVFGADLVAWYRLSFVHHPRTEDYPAQPIVWNSFELMPRDFLDASPLKVTK
jgi:Cu2+-containing amine oxidase